MKKVLHALRWFWTRFPFAPLLVLVLALQVMEEFYPFSHFPMYQRFDEEATYLFITNELDEPLPLQTHFSYKASRVKKNFKSRLRKVAEWNGRKLETATQGDMRAAGAIVLDNLFERALHNSPHKLATIQGQSVRLWHGTLRLNKDDSLDDDRFLLAERAVDPAAIQQAMAQRGDQPAEQVDNADESDDAAGEDSE